MNRDTKTVQEIPIRQLQREIAIRRATKRATLLRRIGLYYVYFGATCGVLAAAWMVGGML